MYSGPLILKDKDGDLWEVLNSGFLSPVGHGSSEIVETRAFVERNYGPLEVCNKEI